MNIIPSIYAHTFSGGILVVGILYFIVYNSRIMSRDPYQLLVLILLFSIAAGVHGISHVGLESVYSYNPLSLFSKKQTEAYHPSDCPYRKNCKCPFLDE
jgi:hypothetical protein